MKVICGVGAELQLHAAVIVEKTTINKSITQCICLEQVKLRRKYQLEISKMGQGQHFMSSWVFKHFYYFLYPVFKCLFLCVISQEISLFVYDLQVRT